MVLFLVLVVNSAWFWILHVLTQVARSYALFVKVWGDFVSGNVSILTVTQLVSYPSCLQHFCLDLYPTFPCRNHVPKLVKKLLKRPGVHHLHVDLILQHFGNSNHVSYHDVGYAIYLVVYCW